MKRSGRQRLRAGMRRTQRRVDAREQLAGARANGDQRAGLAERQCHEKFRYASKALAKNSAAIQRSQSGALYVYACAVCGGWHLTHVPPARHRDNVRREVAGG